MEVTRPRISSLCRNLCCANTNATGSQPWFRLRRIPLPISDCGTTHRQPGRRRSHAHRRSYRTHSHEDRTILSRETGWPQRALFVGRKGRRLACQLGATNWEDLFTFSMVQNVANGILAGVVILGHGRGAAERPRRHRCRVLATAQRESKDRQERRAPGISEHSKQQCCGRYASHVGRHGGLASVPLWSCGQRKGASVCLPRPLPARPLPASSCRQVPEWRWPPYS